MLLNIKTIIYSCFLSLLILLSLLIIRFSFSIIKIENLFYNIIYKTITLYIFIAIILFLTNKYIKLFPKNNHVNENIKGGYMCLLLISIMSIFLIDIRKPDKYDNINYYSIIYSNYKEYHYEEPPLVFQSKKEVKLVPKTHKIQTDVYNVKENKYGAEYYENIYFKYSETAYLLGFDTYIAMLKYIDDPSYLIYALKCFPYFIYENGYFYFTKVKCTIWFGISYLLMIIPFLIYRFTPKTFYNYLRTHQYP